MLEVYKNLLHGFENEGISYVLWKSLEFYQEQLDGEGDIDVLFNPTEQDEVEAYLRKKSYAEDLSSPDRVGRKIKVFRGIDSSTLKHGTVHAHFGCWFGSKRFKEYRFPHEQEMFDSAICELDVLRLSQAHFFITRMLIVALRKTYKDKYISKIANEYKNLGSDQRQLVEKHLGYYFDVEIAQLMNEIERDGPGVLSKVFSHAHSLMDRQNDLKLVRDAVVRENYPKTIRDYYIPRLIKGKRNKLSRPMSIQLAGHDGVGKSTVTRLVRKSMAKISITYRIYLGRSTWAFPNNMINKWRHNRSILRILNLLWPFSSTIEILVRLFIGRIMVKMGFVVIYDRSLIDLILKWERSNKVGAWFPLWVAYRFARKPEADLCYMLHASPDIVLGRKGKDIHSIDEIKTLWVQYQRVAGPHYIFIDTSQLAPEEVAGKILRDAFKMAADPSG